MNGTYNELLNRKGWNSEQGVRVVAPLCFIASLWSSTRRPPASPKSKRDDPDDTFYIPSSISIVNDLVERSQTRYPKWSYRNKAMEHTKGDLFDIRFTYETKIEGCI